MDVIFAENTIKTRQGIKLSLRTESWSVCIDLQPLGTAAASPCAMHSTSQAGVRPPRCGQAPVTQCLRAQQLQQLTAEV